MGNVDWFEDDVKFFQQLRTGHRYAERVAERLRARGLSAEVTPMEIRADIHARHLFADETDLRVGNARRRVDVKSRSLVFTGPHDYPCSTAFVDTVSSWEQKTHKPCAVVLISQPTNGLAVVPRSSRARWTREKRRDRYREILDWFYMVPTRDLATFDAFVAWLKAHDGTSRVA
jgi:hypothetical protein